MLLYFMFACGVRFLAAHTEGKIKMEFQRVLVGDDCHVFRWMLEQFKFDKLRWDAGRNVFSNHHSDYKRHSRINGQSTHAEGNPVASPKTRTSGKHLVRAVAKCLPGFHLVGMIEVQRLAKARK
jgi:hypothetical protein